VPQLLDMPVKPPKAMLADKGYDSDAVRETLLLRGILPIIPPKANRREPVSCDYRRYRDRNQVERLFNRLKQFRRIATRYDKTAMSFLGFLALAAVRVWLPHMSTGPSSANSSPCSCGEPAYYDMGLSSSRTGWRLHQTPSLSVDRAVSAVGR